MDDTPRTSGLPLEEPLLLRYTTDYVRRLLLERHHIYAAITNPGGSIILTATARIDQERGLEYSSAIGSSFHLDLMDLDNAIDEAIYDKSWSKKDLAATLTWIDGMSSQQAAVYLQARGPVAIRKRRERGLRRITNDLNGEPTGRTGDRVAVAGRSIEGDNAPNGGDHHPGQKKEDRPQRDTDEQVRERI